MIRFNANKLRAVYVYRHIFFHVHVQDFKMYRSNLADVNVIPLTFLSNACYSILFSRNTTIIVFRKSLSIGYHCIGSNESKNILIRLTLMSLKNPWILGNGSAMIWSKCQVYAVKIFLFLSEYALLSLNINIKICFTHSMIKCLKNFVKLREIFTYEIHAAYGGNSPETNVPASLCRCSWGFL